MPLDAATLANYNAQIDAANAAGDWDRSWQLAAQRDAWITGQGYEPEAPKSSPHEALLLVAAGVPVTPTPGNMLELLTTGSGKTAQQALAQFAQPAPVSGGISAQVLVLVAGAIIAVIVLVVLFKGVRHGKK